MTVNSSSITIALLGLVSVLALGIVIFIVRALRPAEPATPRTDKSTAPEELDDLLADITMGKINHTGFEVSPKVETINPYEPNVAATTPLAARR